MKEAVALECKQCCCLVGSMNIKVFVYFVKLGTKDVTLQVH